MTKGKAFKGNLFAMILIILPIVLNLLKSIGLITIFQNTNIFFGFKIVISQLMVLLLPTIIYFLITKKSIVKTLRLKPIGTKTILISIIIGITVQPMTMFLSFLTQLIFPNRIGQVVMQINDIPLLIKIGIIALTPAICEEVTMRGVLLSSYDNISLKKAAIINGLFFCMLHMDGNQSLYTFVLGVIFAYLVRITGSIYTSMICHFTINSIGVILSHFMGKIQQNSQGLKTESVAQLPTYQILSSGILLFIIAIISFKIVMHFIKKLEKIYAFKDIYIESNEKIINLPLYISIIVYIFIIAGQLIQIYSH